MSRRLRSRPKSCRTENIVLVLVIGFIWYLVITHRTRGKDTTAVREKIYSREPYHFQNAVVVPGRIYEPNDRDIGKVKDKEKTVPHSSPAEEHHLDIVEAPRKDESRNEDRSPVKAESVVPRTPRVKPQLAWSSASSANAPIILVWKAMEYQMKRHQELLEFYTPPECGGCQVTTNRTLVRKCAALVHFNSPELRKNMDVPDPEDRNPDQIYAFWSRETPSKTYHFSDVIKNPRFDPIFNITINFRVDSDIVDYFGNVEYELRSLEDKHDGWFEKIMSRKSGFAVWAVSNCNSTYGAAERMKYAKSLIRAGLKLTTYGSCFGNRNSGPDFIQELMRHKFYISFENSIHCPDYVSEKFWRNGLRGGVVPIVWGPTREDVARIAPAHSYIHTEDFKTPEELVKYLEYLDQNDTAYREYHAWRFRPVDESILYEDIIPNHWSTMCRLCKKVVEKPLVHKRIPSVANWLYGTRYADDLCFKT